ncbi:MAG: GIY-YIG nuclease family protein [Sediminibacterium sp.]|jgi:putative endonuclease|nr:GIY-YIG nuclease family protein [Chitinophagaceae bacterium]MCA6478826.1 GIY-YIG nuclease family protein [Chitinophagaceae bacterium]MCA6480504.1 GIY-YIG nuclease family protein [Chitinophagaceae bacterium]MCA6489286.1 GIY-YIG nuclease family protein [Chitinophagaceae bacterium]MCE2973942.1 GIY-YIG nuclease family protein [Sediminibacterium sp.]
MVEVYAILSIPSNEIYVGMALSAEKRLKEHNNGKNRFTKGLRPWKIIHIEYFADWKSARVREKYLKSGVGKEFLKRLVP